MLLEIEKVGVSIRVKKFGSFCTSHILPIDAVVAEVNFLEYWNEKSFVKANVLPHAEGGALGQYEVLQMEEMTSDAPSINSQSQVLPVQVGAQSDDLQVVACNIDIAFFFVCLPSFIPSPYFFGGAVFFFF